MIVSASESRKESAPGVCGVSILALVASFSTLLTVTKDNMASSGSVMQSRNLLVQVLEKDWGSYQLMKMRVCAHSALSSMCIRDTSLLDL